MSHNIQQQKDLLTQLYTKHIDMVYRICFLLLKSSNDAEDAVQIVFMKAIEKEMIFESHEHEKAWLIVTAQNHCKNQLKHWWRKTIPFDMNIHDSSHNNPHNDILELVMKLPDKFKIPIYLYYYEGYQTDEIAHMLSLNPSTLRSRLKKGREILKLEIGGLPHE